MVFCLKIGLDIVRLNFIPKNRDRARGVFLFSPKKKL